MKNILFLTDFSGPSAAALPFAFCDCAHLRIYRARSKRSSAFSLQLCDSRKRPRYFSTIRKIWRRPKCKRWKHSLWAFLAKSIIERGMGVWPVLSEMLKKGDIDLIVLGTQGRTGLQKILLGSSAEEVFRRSPVPVLTIGPSVRDGAHNAGRFRCVLFATDFHAVSPAAAAYAVSLAQENQARLVLLHVLPEGRQTERAKNPTNDRSQRHCTTCMI